MNFEALIKTLESEIEVYGEFLQVEKDKTEIIIEGNVDKLDKIMNTEQAMAMKLNGIEKRRMGIMDGLGLHDKTLREVIAIAENDEGKTRGRLFKIYKELKESTDQLKEVNDYNAILIKSRLDVITGFTEYLESAMSPNPNENKRSKLDNLKTYDKNAKVVPQSKRNDESTIKRRF
jgi:FlgN protein.